MSDCYDLLSNGGHDENIEESEIIQKVLTSLTLIFNAKVPIVEELKYLEIMNMDEFHVILTTYEIRI